MFGREEGVAYQRQCRYSTRRKSTTLAVNVLKPCEDVREIVREEHGDGRAKQTCVSLVSQVITRTVCDMETLRPITDKENQV